jgi:GWxTD domain-containing protein
MMKITTRTRTPALFAALVMALCLPINGAWSRPDERLERMPEKYRKWLEQEVVYIITDHEREAFLDLQSVQEWEAFMAAFWRRRDPDPLTPVNEFKEEHYRRLEYANRELGREASVPGWMTDRGKMYIILGKPHDRETFRAIPGIYPAELWFYMADKEHSLPPMYLLFFQDNYAGPYRLFNYLLDQPEDLLPAQTWYTNDTRREAYDLLENFSPDLARATLTMRADEGIAANLFQTERAGLDYQVLLSDIEQSPFRRVDTSYVDAARDARGLVESEYLFNYIPNYAVADVLPGPGGTSFVHYSIEIEPQHMTLAKDERENVYYTRFELRGEVTTTDGEKVLLQFVKEPYMRLTESQFQDVQSRPFSYRDMFPIAFGDYRFRVVLKNRARSEYTIFETDLHVPSRGDAPFLAAPVLLYGTNEMTSSEPADAYRTYQLGSLRLNPNAKRAFVIGEALRAYIPVENVTAEHQLSLRLVSQEDPSQVLDERQQALGQYGGNPVVESFPLVDVTSGRYRLVADLLSPSGDVLASTFADFDVTPRTAIARPWVMRETIDGEEIALTWSAVAEQYLKLGETETARKMYEDALKNDPNLTTARIVLARLHLDEKRSVEAIKLLEPAYAQNKDDAQVLLLLGDAHFQSGNYPRAAKLYEEAIILRPPTPSLFNALGICYAQQGNAEKAVHYLERSLELDPDQEQVKDLMEKLKNPSGQQK